MKILLAAVVLPAFFALPLYAANVPLSIRLAEAKGEVSARADPAAAWTPVKDGAMLAPGGEARTGPGGSVVLAFSDGNKVRLGPATTFGVEGATTLKTSLRLFAGRLEAWVKRTNKADFTVRHRAGAAAARGAVFAMEGDDLGLEIALFSGALDIVDNFGRPSSMSPGQNAHVSAEAGLLGLSSLPPGARAPEEPRVQAPPPPPATVAGTTDVPPEALPATETAAPVPPSPAQEREAADSTVSPSAP